MLYPRGGGGVLANFVLKCVDINGMEKSYPKIALFITVII
jgi:hypothetical protein